MKNVTLYSASAGTGKTYTICQEISRRVEKGLDPRRILACTFTKKAAAELKSRVQRTLLEKRLVEQAAALELAAIGTVHSVGHRFISRFALRLGLSPDLSVVPEGGDVEMLKATLAGLDPAPWERLADLERRLSRSEDGDDDREPLILTLLRLKRQNAISDAAFKTQLEASAKRFVQVLAGHGPRGRASFEDAAREARELCAAAAAALGRLAGADHKDALEAVSRIARHGPLSWKEMARLSVIKAGKTPEGEEALAPLRRFAGGLRAHPALAADCLAYMDLLADRALELQRRYEDYKRERGLLDYTDMEAHFHRLVTDPELRDSLRAEVHMAVVDEFQDSNPVQLAIFLALAELARECVWVGDQKQTIYAFNGAAPDLMAAIWKDRRVSRETLAVNRRSAAGIVHVANKVFTPVFGEDSAMEPHEAPLPTAAERWLLVSKNQDGEARALARGIAGLLGRPGRRKSDVAVLVRTNTWGKLVARSLEENGIPAALAIAGLLSTRECAAVLAGLRLVADRRDSLAAATLLHLLETDGNGTPAWFAARLKEVRAARAGAQNGARPVPFAGHPRIQRLENLDYRHLSPSGSVAAVIQALSLGAGVGDWEEPARRATQLDALLAAAKNYEQAAIDSGRAATLTGLITHLEALETDGEDLREPPQGLDAVQVLTYHRAKGLEWPVVILTQLDKVFDGSPFKPAVTGGKPEAGRPLDGRRLSFWPDPFDGADLLALQTDAAATPEATAAQEEVNAESRRLLYVGFTRPKELLVLATRVSPNKSGDSHKHQWLDQLPGFGQALGGVTSPGDHKVKGIAGAIRVARVEPPAGPPEARLQARQRWIESPSGAQAYPRRYRNPSAEPPRKADFLLNALPGQHPFPASFGSLDPEALGRALHSYFSSLPSLRTLAPEAKRTCADRLLKNFELGDALAAPALVSAGERLEAWVEKQFPGASWRTEIAVTAPAPQGAQWHGTIDLMLALPDGAVAVLDHKSFFGKDAHLRQRAADYAGQLAAYSAALSACGMKVVLAGLHLPLAGVIAAADLQSGSGRGG